MEVIRTECPTLWPFIVIIIIALFSNVIWASLYYYVKYKEDKKMEEEKEDLNPLMDKMVNDRIDKVIEEEKPKKRFNVIVEQPKKKGKKFCVRCSVEVKNGLFSKNYFEYEDGNYCKSCHYIKQREIRKKNVGHNI